MDALVAKAAHEAGVGPDAAPGSSPAVTHTEGSTVQTIGVFFTKENAFIHSASKALSYSILKKNVFALFSFHNSFKTDRVFHVLTKIFRDQGSIILFPLIIKITLRGFCLQPLPVLHDRAEQRLPRCL